MLNHPYLVLSFSANLSVFMFFGLSATFWLSLITFTLVAFRSLVTFKVTKNDLFIFFSCICIAPLLFLSIDAFAFDRFFLFVLICGFIYFFFNVNNNDLLKIAENYYKISIFLISSAFIIFLMSKVGLITLDRFISYGGRFAGFSFENVDNFFVLTFLILYIFIRNHHRKMPIQDKLLGIFLFSLLVLSQSNMTLVLLFTIFQTYLIKWFKFRHQSSLFILGSSFLILYAFDFLLQSIPSIRGGSFDVLQRLDGAQFLLEAALEQFKYISFEFFTGERTCLMASGTNNFGFLNLTCDFGISGFVILLIMLIFVERNLDASSRAGFYLCIIVMFSINSILLVPNYYNPTYIFALIFGVRYLRYINESR